MTTIATCGHAVNIDESIYVVTTKEETITEQGWTDCLVTKSICEDCYNKSIEDKLEFIDVRVISD